MKRGTRHSKEAKEKMRKAQLGKKHSKEAKEKMSKKALGRKHTERAKEKMRRVKRSQWGDPIKRFWSHVNKSEGPDGCWIWIGDIGDKGYGRMRWERKRNQRAHRIAWSLAFGPIPKNLCVLHRCDNTRCVNPKHLWIGTSADNTKDMIRKGRQAKGEARNTPRGEKVGSSKLTEKDVLEIRKLVAAGVSQRKIATRFKITQPNVNAIINRRSWKHI